MSDSIPLSAIDFTTNRDMGDLSGLQDSLRRLGTIHPPALSKYVAEDGTVRYKPVAGRRRLHALRANGAKELFHNSILDPERPGFSFKDEVPEDELLEATLDENLYRLKPKWQEDCLLVADVHAMKRKIHGANEWGVRQTAALLGEGYGKSNVSLALNVAKLLIAKDPEILAAENLMEANTIRIKRQEDKALAELQKRVQLPKTDAPTSLTVTANLSSFLDSFSVPGVTSSETVVVHAPNPTAPTLQPAPLVSAPPVSVPLSKMFYNMDFRKAYRLGLKVNHIVTDIPYGIDMNNLNSSVKLDSVVEEHAVEANIELMPAFLKFAWDTLLPHGFCVFFYDLDHHEKLQTWARDIGFKVQRWPLHACKTSACQNNAAQYNITKNVEHAMILRKDEHTVLRKDPSFTFNNSCWASYDFAAERKMYNNPFAKPFALWKDIYDIIAFPGQSVLDPFCGEMSACRAAANCGLVPYGVELNEQHYNRGLQHMKAVYASIHASNCEFV
jgi:DNA modification methylase/ParB-like chromosome segregation protein Spo0J